MARVKLRRYGDGRGVLQTMGFSWRYPRLQIIYRWIDEAVKYDNPRLLKEVIAQHENEMQKLDIGRCFVDEFNWALTEAIRIDSEEVVECLLQTQRIQWSSHLVGVMKSARKFRYLDLFYRHGFKPVEIGKYGGLQPLWHQAIPKHLDVVPWLLLHGVDINDRGDTYKTPLDNAAEFGSIEAFKFLVHHGAIVEKSDVLITAARPTCTSDKDAIKMIEYLLLEVGVNVNTVSDFPQMRHRGYMGWKQTALHEAVWSGRKSILKFLLEHGADPNIEDGFGQTPLSCAQERARVVTLDIEKWQAQARLLEEWVKAKDNAIPERACAGA